MTFASMGSGYTPVISAVVPCFNEQEVIETTHERLVAELAKISDRFEIIYVNDGSRDDTLALLLRLHQVDQRAKVVNLSRNFGHQIAVSAGLDYAQGNAVVVIDADLQDPPHLIARMVEKWREGFHVVYGKRAERAGETRFKLATAHLFYRLLNSLSDTPIPKDVGDFRLLDRRVVDALKAMPERSRFLRGMASWAGFRQYALEYQRDPRFAGETKYPLKRMLRLASDGILSFSVAPLRAAIWLGLSAAALAFAGILYALTLRLFTNMWVEGWTFMVIAMSFLGGVQLLCLGALGEYIGRIFTEVKGRPLYFVADELGFEARNERAASRQDKAA